MTDTLPTGFYPFWFWNDRLSADEIRQWIVDAPAMTDKTKAERKPPMKSYATLPKEELDGLVAYMQSLKKK